MGITIPCDDLVGTNDGAERIDDDLKEKLEWGNKKERSINKHTQRSNMSVHRFKGHMGQRS